MNDDGMPQRPARTSQREPRTAPALTHAERLEDQTHIATVAHRSYKLHVTTLPLPSGTSRQIVLEKVTTDGREFWFHLHECDVPAVEAAIASLKEAIAALKSKRFAP